MNAAGTMFDKTVRVARQRDPQARLVGVSLQVVRSPASDFGWFRTYLYSPLEDTVLSYQIEVDSQDAAPVNSPFFLRVGDVSLWSSSTKPDGVPLLDAAKLDWRAVAVWHEPWGATLSWPAGFTAAWKLGGSPSTFVLSADASAVVPYDLNVYIDDGVPGPGTSPTTLAWVIFVRDDYYAKVYRR